MSSESMGTEQHAPLTEEDLRQRLAAAGIVIDSWGTGRAKTLGHLLSEIVSGEARLVEGPSGALLRQTIVGKADVY